jgi:hypothetical protein
VGFAYDEKNVSITHFIMWAGGGFVYDVKNVSITHFTMWTGGVAEVAERKPSDHRP